jgi:hypothetical protein
MPLIIPANSITGGFAVDNSLRFNDGSSDSLNKTGSSGNRKTWTWSCWIKRSTVGSGSSHLIFGASSDGFSTDYFDISFTSADKINIQDYQGSEALRYIPTRVFRDVSAWYHIVIRVDTTQGTASNRLRIYINGVEETAFDTETDPSQNTDLLVNNNVVHRIGGRDGDYSNLYLAECVLIDGSSLAPTSFGEFDEDTGIWKPIDVSGLTFGTNGFYLDFEDSSNLGNDANGGTDFTVNNLTAIDQTTDTPTNNFCTLNPLVTATSFTDNQNYSEGNTIIIPNSTDNYGTTFSTIGVQGSGKWYWEAQVVWNGTSTNANFPRTIGFVTEDYAFNYSYLGQDQESWGMLFSDDTPDQWFASHPDEDNNVGGTMVDGDIVNLALDLDNGYFYFGVNGTYLNSGDPTSGASGTGAVFTLTATDLSKFIIPAVTNATNTTYYKFNFGNPPYTISSGNSDANNYGNFEYAVPSGYYALNTKNLAEFG